MMQIKFFTIPILGGEKMTEELNTFLRSKRIVSTDCQLTQSQQVAYWCFCVKYLEGINKSEPVYGRKDYSAILDAAAFKRFENYRAIRKRLAKEEGIPAFAVFSDEELVSLARLEKLTIDQMKNINGIGEKKIEKYVSHFLTQDTHAQD